jgi:hypothetical protein
MPVFRFPLASLHTPLPERIYRRSAINLLGYYSHIKQVKTKIQ